MESKNARHAGVLNQGHFFLFLLIAFAVYAVFRVLKPYLNTIILAIILGSVLNPVNARIEKLVHGRRNAAAVLSCVLLFFLIVLPLSLVFTTLVQQGITTVNSIQVWLDQGSIQKIVDSEFAGRVMAFLKQYLPEDFGSRLTQSAMSVSSSFGKFIIGQGGNILGNITAIVAKFFLMIFVFFYVVRDGSEILNKILHLIPLSSTHETRILLKIKTVARSVFLGVFLTSLCQGIAGGLALSIAGLPGLFLGSLMVFTSLIPFVGTALIWIPAAAYLVLKGLYIKALLIAVWHIAVVGTMDNILRPFFMGGPSGMSPLFILFAILGGIQLFGLIGILYGPLIFSIAMVLLYIYQLEFEPFLTHQDHA